MKNAMESLNLEKERKELIDWVSNLTDTNAINKLMFLKNNQNKVDWWDEITDEEKSSIEKGLADIKAGRVIPHSEVKKIYEKWL